MWASNKIKQWVKTRFHIRIVKVCKYYLLSFILFPDPRYFVYSAESPALLFQIALTWPRSFWCENILREAEIIVLADNCHISDRGAGYSEVPSERSDRPHHTGLESSERAVPGLVAPWTGGASSNCRALIASGCERQQTMWDTPTHPPLLTLIVSLQRTETTVRKWGGRVFD